MNREQLMKMSKKELKARLVTVGKEAQDKSGEELTALMDEARTIGEILDEIKAREELARAAQAAAGEGEGPDGNAGEGAEVKDQARAKSGKALKAGAKTTYNAKKIAKPMAALSTTTGVVMPHHTSPDIAPTFNNVSSLIDRVTTIPLVGGETYSRPYVKSYGDGAGSTAEGADYNTSEPEFGYAEIAREKITAYAEEPEEGIFYNPASESDDIIDRNTDITTITAVTDDTLDEIIYSYGGDEEVEDVAVLILSKKDLKKFAKLRDKQGRKVYTIVNHGNTGTIDEVPYIINSACAEIGGTKDAYCMAYGPLSNYEVAVFSDIETAKSTDYKFKSGQICYKGCVFMGGNVVARNGFIRVKNPAA